MQDVRMYTLTLYLLYIEYFHANKKYEFLWYFPPHFHLNKKYQTQYVGVLQKKQCIQHIIHCTNFYAFNLHQPACIRCCRSSFTRFKYAKLNESVCDHGKYSNRRDYFVEFFGDVIYRIRISMRLTFILTLKRFM